MGAEGGRDRTGVTALGEGITGQIDLATVQILGVSQHRQGALVQRLAIYVDPGVLFRRLQTARRLRGRGRRRCFGGRWDQGDRRRGRERCLRGCGDGRGSFRQRNRIKTAHQKKQQNRSRED